MSVTLKEVSEQAGVSRSAVSRTFTDGASVSAKTRKKVKDAAAALGYIPSLIASSLKTKRTKLIGLVANNFQNPVFLQVFDLFTRALQARGFRPLLVNLTDETDPAHSVSMLKQYSVDGVIVATSTLSPAFARAFHLANVPVVHAFGRYDKDVNVDVVGIDNVECGKMAANTLLERGYRQIAVLAGPENATSTQDRVKGFRQAMMLADVEISDISFARSYSHAAGLEAMTALLQRTNVEAVFCGDDLICMGAMDLARTVGLSIPGDIGFLGFNDMEMASWQAYNLTTIRQPIADIIQRAVEVISAMDDAPAKPATQLFPCGIVERGTLRPLVI
ncbi:MAG: LacI family DNA-binding transcriptional regulator [Rhizobiaceae bacterium]